MGRPMILLGTMDERHVMSPPNDDSRGALLYAHGEAASDSAMPVCIVWEGGF
jgi:hypothetical protein